MKKLLLSALLVLLAAALHAQEFYRITDIDDGERALEVSAVSYLDASENRFGAQVAYEIKPLTAYFEVSFFFRTFGRGIWRYQIQGAFFPGRNGLWFFRIRHADAFYRSLYRYYALFDGVSGT